MKASELRAGNIIASRDGAYFRVSPEIFSAPEFWTGIETYKPLILTAEWLRILGFTETGEDVYRLRPYPGLTVRSNKEEFEIIFNDCILFSRTFHVHSFQNLIFELTGEELPAIEVKDELGEAIGMVADGILYQYIPADPSQKQLSFELTIEGEAYCVNYQKDDEGFWQFRGYNKKANGG